MNTDVKNHFLDQRKNRLFIGLGAFFLANTLIAEMIGVKLFSLERSLGFEPIRLMLFGTEVNFTLSVGVLPWPIVFILTDIINEYFGYRGVRFLSILTSVLIAFAFLIFYGAIQMAPADFWLTSQQSNGVLDMQVAYRMILGQSMSIIYASIIAFLVGQLLDAHIFTKIKQYTGEKKIYLRATGSTLISQLIDTIIVNYLYLYVSLGFPFVQVTAICLMGYIFKFLVAIISTPALYLGHFIIRNYLAGRSIFEWRRKKK